MLGLTQDEMSRIVGVSRSQWSMYELGRRELPMGAMQVVSKLLSGLKSAEKARKISTDNTDDMQRIVKRLLDENLFQQTSLKREIFATENKLAERERRMFLVEYFKSGDFEPRHQAVTLIPAARNNSTLNDKKISENLLVQNLKLEMLQEEEKILRSKLINQN